MKYYAAAAVATLLMASPSFVLALGDESFGNAPAVKQPGWAEGVLDVNIRNHFQATLEQIEKAKEKPGNGDRLKRERVIAKEIAEFKKAIGEKK